MGENSLLSIASSGLFGFERNQTRRTDLVGQTSHRALQRTTCPAKTLCFMPLLNEACSSKDYVQEKALAKLKIQQELSETLAEEAVYRVAFSEEYQESEGESVHNLPTSFGNIIDTFLHDQESYFPTQPSVTQSLNNVTQSSVPATQPLVPVAQPSVRLKQSSVPVTQPLVSVARSLVPVTQPPSITQFTDPLKQASVSVAYPFSSGFQLSTTVSQSSPLHVQTSALVVNLSTPVAQPSPLVTPNRPSFSTCTPACQSLSKYSLPRSSSSFLSSLYSASTRRYPLTVTYQDTITCTVSSSVCSPTSFNVDYQPGTSYPRSLYGNSTQPSQISSVCYLITG